jgi:hypothetical protein
MTFSVFFALLQVLLRAEPKFKDQNRAQSLSTLAKEIIRKDSEPIPSFIKRYQIQSFLLWENSFPLNNQKPNTHATTESAKK